MTEAGSSGPEEFALGEQQARGLDAADPLAPLAERFRHPRRADGTPSIYFCGNSLGLQPVAVEADVRQELSDWAELAVDAHFRGRNPWYSYHRPLAEPLARLVGARPDEVVLMNGLSVNLHLMLVSFFRPAGGRRKVLMEAAAFPSDTYAVQSQLRFHGLDPETDLLVPGTSDDAGDDSIEELLERRGEEIAVVLLGGVNYYTGRWFDLARIATLARSRGCRVGLDLAHAVGNVPLRLHDWDVDFAVWCSYKYLNGGPGAVAGCFVHERHAEGTDLPRFAGWWGNDPERRFRMHLERGFEPVRGADGWQLSNPPILALAPLRSALALFDEAGMDALRAKSLRLTAYLEGWIDRTASDRIRVLTPRDPRRRGCQLSLRATERPRELFGALERAGVVGDYREPDVIRLAPVPLYNSFHQVWRVGQVVRSWAAGG